MVSFNHLNRMISDPWSLAQKVQSSQTLRTALPNPKAPAGPVPWAHSHEGLNVEGWEDGSRAPRGRNEV